MRVNSNVYPVVIHLIIFKIRYKDCKLSKKYLNKVITFLL